MERYLSKIESPLARGHMRRAIEMLKSGVCQHLFLDVGSNRGIQIRKLYERKRYPDADAHKYFDQYFGDYSIENRRKVCSIGFEPNSKWDTHLGEMERVYKKNGFNIVMFTSTAANTNSKNVSFYRNQKANNDPKNIEASATLFDYGDRKASVTASINFVSFLKIFLNEFKKKETVVVMKMDVEGWEFELIPPLILGGSICAVNFAFTEFHKETRPKACPSNFLESVNWMITTTPNCPTKFLSLDDESYGSTHFPLPKSEEDFLSGSIK